MGHLRKRQVEEVFLKLMGFSPIIGLFGHRQVGKSTFAADVAGQYWTLDDQDTRDEVNRHAKQFIQKQSKLPVVIDECQLEPSLFPALKERVRTFKKPGQFVLTGSVRFTSRKAIRESLAGRITVFEMLPLVLSELNGTPLPDVLPQLMRHREFTESSLSTLKTSAQTLTSKKTLEKYLQNGGLPGLCFVRENRLREEGLLDLHRLILDRDLRMVVQTKLSLETLMRFLRWIARNSWNSYNASEVRRELGLAPATQRHLLFALESIFLIRRLPINGRSGEVILFEDQYEEKFLSDDQVPHLAQLTSALYRNGRAQFQYRLEEKVRFETYRTRFEARVPLMINGTSGQLGLVVFEGEKPTLSQRRSGDSFLRHYPLGKIIYLSDEKISPKILDNRSLVCPLASVI
jgi:predicted AAA+ superfamily ATPase